MSQDRRENWREWLYANMDPAAWPRNGLSPLNHAISALICLAALFAIIESEPSLYIPNIDFFFWVESAFGAIFLTEYVARIWIAGENPRYAGFSGRIRYILSVPAIIDLLALSPLLLAFVGTEVFLLRLFRLIRILRLARLGRYSKAINTIVFAVKSRSYELLMSLCFAGILLLVSSTLLYLFESDTQPESFGSIPRAMWWSIATLTTVGYGDVYPITMIGKVLAGFTAITGIGLIAMPTGILAAAFSDAIQKQRESKNSPRGTEMQIPRSNTLTEEINISRQ